MFPQFTKFHLFLAARNETLFFLAKPSLIVLYNSSYSTLLHFVRPYTTTHDDQNVRVILLNFFSYQMYMIFLLALLPDRNTSPHCWPNIHNRVVFLKLDAKILSKVSSLVGW